VINVIEQILSKIGSGKFITLHSRNAHNELSLLLDKYNVAPVCFHYFIGGPDAAVKLVDRGHYFSINSRCVASFSYVVSIEFTSFSSSYLLPKKYKKYI